MSDNTYDRQYLADTLEAVRKDWRFVSLLLFCALVVIAFVVAVISGLHSLGGGIASWGGAIALAASLVRYWSARRIHQVLATNASDSETRQLRQLRDSPLKHYAISMVSAGFLFLLAYWAFSQAQPVRGSFGESSVSQIGTLSQRLTELTDQVSKLATAISRPSAERESSLPPKVQPGAQTLKGQVDLAVPWWVEALFWVPTIVLAIFALSELFKSGMRSKKALLLGASTLLSLAIPLNLKGEFNLPVNFRCENCSMKLFESPNLALRDTQSPSPAFDIGEDGIAKSGQARCVEPIASREEWGIWRKKMAQEWCNRPNASGADSLWIVGSADRQQLGRPLTSKLGFNEGLARRRAEAVRQELLDAITRTCKEMTPSSDRVFVLTRGPANAAAIGARVKDATLLCSDRDLTDDRRVHVWLNVASGK